MTSETFLHKNNEETETIKMNFYRTLEMNQRLAVVWEVCIKQKMA